MALENRDQDERQLARLARASGTFAMLAIDQRETLRSLLASVIDGPVDDSHLIRFKLDVTRILTPFASAVLIDTVYGLDPMEREGTRAPECGLIVAADRFDQQPGGPVERVHLDEDACRRAADAGADALKLLVLWRGAADVDERARLVGGFIEACRCYGLLAIVEGIVREPMSGSQPIPPDAFDEFLLQAADELCAFGPDIYKAEVPTLGAGSDEAIETTARELTRIANRPWVVLSTGVPVERFEGAVRAACRGGASGFLAGRGIWRQALEPTTRQANIHQISKLRLQRLTTTVDELARPWWSALG